MPQKANEAMFRVLNQRRNQNKKNRSTVVSFEPCESRQMMSASTLPIIIQGTSGSDYIELSYSESNGHT